MTPNRHLGDVPIELVMTSGNKVTFIMRPTPQATMEIEDVFGMGLPAIAMQLAAGNVRMQRMAEIIVAGAKAAGHIGESFSDNQGGRIDLEMRADRLYDPIFYTGRWKVQEACYKFLDACLNGGISSEDLKKSGVQQTAAGAPVVSIGANGPASQPSNSAGQNESSGAAAGGPSSPPSNG